MQQFNDGDSLSGIEEFAYKDYRTLSCFNELFKCIHPQGLLRMLNACKLKGFNGFALFQVLFFLPFVDKHNVHQLVRSRINDWIDGRIDTLYRF